MTDERTAVATQLRELAAGLAEASKDCLTWADLKGSNEMHAKVASGWIHRAIQQGYVEGISGSISKLIANRAVGSVNWAAIAERMNLSKDEWLSEFFNSGPRAKRLTWRGTLEQDEEGLISNDLSCVETEIDRTADELRVWYKQQSLALSLVLNAIAKRIDETPTSDESWKEALKLLTKDQTPIANEIRRKGPISDDALGKYVNSVDPREAVRKQVDSIIKSLKSSQFEVHTSGRNPMFREIRRRSN